MHRKNFAGIDYFRLVAAFLVIAIHTAPFSSWNNDFDFLFTYCLGRIAVPFFLMTTGFFVLAPYIQSGFQKRKSLHNYLVKNTQLYLAATVFYLPLTIYSHNLPHNVPEFLKDLFFDGTFYHLWYFPAAIIGCLIIILISELSVKTAFIISAVFYIIGLFGDSYYGLIKEVPFLCSLYDGIFQISSYTRNGIFFTPVFLMLGVLTALPEFQCSKKVCTIGLTVSFPLLFLEGFLTYQMDLQKHNSMYLGLLPVMYFLFQLLLTFDGDAPPWLRNGSMLLYLIHPAAIILLRQIAKTTNLTDLIINNTLIHYLCVCTISMIIITGFYACKHLKEKMTV